MKKYFKKFNLKALSDSYRVARNNFLVLKAKKRRLAIIILSTWAFLVITISIITILNIFNIWEKNTYQPVEQKEQVEQQNFYPNTGSENVYIT